MRIANIEVFVLGDPQPPESVDDYIAHLAFVRITTDEGISGLAEVFSVPPSVAKAVLNGPDSFFGGQLIGEDPLTPERLRERLYNSMLHGNRRGWAVICMGAVEVALWDIYGKMLGRPVYQLLGGVERPLWQVHEAAQPHEVVPYCTVVSPGWDREHGWERKSMLAAQLAKVETLCELGFRAIKIEPLRSTPDTVVELTRLAREVLGPERLLCVDVGYLWNDWATAVRVAERLLELDVFFLETPFPVDHLDAYANLTARSRLPIAVGEHTVTRWEFLELMDRGGVQVVQPYMTTCGGLSEAKRIVDLAMARGVLVCPGNWSTQVLGAATVQLVANSPISPIFEYAPAQIYWSPLRRAIQDVSFPVRNGVIALPTVPGNGIELPPDVIAHFRMG
jgi:L-alanine-DL-glutamate epimerase-like enolase superfamily enzyme